MSEKKDKSGKGKGVVKTLLLGVIAIGAGGATVFGLMATGVIDGHRAQARPSGPQLIAKGDEDPYALASSHMDGKDFELVYGDGGSRYRTAYYSFEDDFTSNLKDTDALIQVSLAASTRRDGRVLMWLDEHELAVRSRILVTLADTPEDTVLTPEGKVRLQQRLTKAVNEVLTEQEGFGGIDNVYFRSLIVQ